MYNDNMYSYKMLFPFTTQVLCLVKVINIYKQLYIVVYKLFCMMYKLFSVMYKLFDEQ